MARSTGKPGDLDYVPTKMTREMRNQIDALATADRSLWHDFGGVRGEGPCRSTAIRKLLEEALEARANRNQP